MACAAAASLRLHGGPPLNPSAAAAGRSRANCKHIPIFIEVYLYLCGFLTAKMPVLSPAPALCTEEQGAAPQHGPRSLTVIQHRLPRAARILAVRFEAKSASEKENGESPSNECTACFVFLK